MPELLVSVRNAKEAAVVVNHPVAILDVKEPDRGALGAPSASTLQQITQVIPSHQTLSFAAGELTDWYTPDQQREFDQQYAGVLPRFKYVKVGLAGMRGRANWKPQWRALFCKLPPQTTPVTVAYLDAIHCNSPDPSSLIEFAASESNCSTLLLDTFHKSGNLFEHISTIELKRLITDAHDARLRIVIAGSVSQSCLAELVALQPDFIGVRGAVCYGDRSSEIDGRLVNELANTLQAT